MWLKYFLLLSAFIYDGTVFPRNMHCLPVAIFKMHILKKQYLEKQSIMPLNFCLIEFKMFVNFHMVDLPFLEMV